MFGFVPRSLAVVGIVGALSFGMPVAAQADTSVKVLQFIYKVASFGGLAGVGVKAAAPEVMAGTGMACAAALPLCAAVAAATVGAALYMTQDTWVPWLKGAFGNPSNDVTTTGMGLLYEITFKDNQPPAVDEEMVPIWFHYQESGYTDHWTIQLGVTLTCDKNGVITHPQKYGSAQMGHGIYLQYGFYPSGDLSVPGCDTNQGKLKGLTETALMPAEQSYGTDLTWGVTPGVTAANTSTSAQVDCVNPDGSQYSVTAAVPLEGDLVKIPTCTGAAGDLGGAHGKCVTLSAGETGGVMVVQSSNCAVVSGSDLQYPDCAVSGCAYMVIVDGIPCTVGRPGCTDWARTYQESPARVGCRYGEYAVKVSSCFFLERVYESVGLPVDGTLANTDGSPATWTGDAPAAQPQPQPQPIPNGAPGGDPGTLPGGGTAPLPSPGSDPQTNNDCWSGGSFSWNPVDWVMVPTKCALSWAFVPKTATLATLADGAKTDLTTQGIGPIINAVNVNVAKVGGGGGCEGPAVTFAAVGISEPMHPFAACTAPMSTLAGISYAMTTVVVIVGGGFVAVKAIGAGFGFNFSMGKGGESA